VSPVLEAHDLVRHYRVQRGMFGGQSTIQAVAGVSLSLEPRKTLAVVGESGCGKSSLARVLTMIEEPTSGSLAIAGERVDWDDTALRKKLRRDVQIVFQNPYGSLNPRQTIGQALDEPLYINTDLPAAERRKAVADMLARVGLRPEHAGRYPHMFSGGQRQRIAIARALMLRPKVLVLDEPVSALDLSVRAQVLNLLAELQDGFGLAYVFVSHDLSVVKHIADDVMVMYLGRVVEMGPSATIFAAPQHPYTQALISATPVADPERRKERIILQGEMPSPFKPPTGCPFHPRCPRAMPRCRAERPELERKQGRDVACFAVA